MAYHRLSVLQVSDLHVDPGTPADLSVLERVGRTIDQIKPDLIAVTGDISQDGFKHPHMLDVVRDAMRQWAPPVYIIPGNHDIGDRFQKVAPKNNYLNQWMKVFGQDHFSVEKDGWRLIGIDSEIIGVGMPEEDAQHHWLVEQIDAAEAAGQYVAFFMHGPPYLRDPHESFTDHSSYWSIKPPTRPRLLKQLERPHVRLLANGHMHWYHATQHRGLPWYWAPSAKAAVDDAKFPGDGEIVGLMHYELGDGDVKANLIRYDIDPGTYYFGRPKINAPGHDTPIELAHLVVPLHVTLSSNGTLTTSIATKLTQVADVVRVTVLADDVAEATRLLGDLPVRVRDAKHSDSALDAFGRQRMIIIGDAGKDRALLDSAAIGLSIGGPCNASASAPVQDVMQALDLVADPAKLQQALQG